MDAIIGTGNKTISKREYGIIENRDVSVPMSDGITLNVDVFRPDSDGKFPALVAISAFNKEIQSERIWPSAARSRRINGTPDAAIESGPTDFFVRRGYVHIVGSVRGTGRSGGAFQFVSPKEVRDIYDVVEWAAVQPWCNGKVGMLGIGDAGAYHPMVAVMQPPHLKAIAPLAAFWDTYREFWYPGGILANGFLRWIISLVNLDVHTQGSSLKEEVGDKGFKDAIERALADRDITGVPDLAEALKNPDTPPNSGVLDVLLHPAWSSYWQERAVLDLGKIKVPTYLGAAVHRPAALNRWSELKIPKKATFGPPAYVDRPFYQYAWELLRWYDYWLKGLDTGIMDEPAIKVFVQGSNEWKMGEDWPFPETKWIPFALHENRSLCEIEPWPDAESASYDDAPGKRGFLKYYSAPMVENTEVIGPLALYLYASCRGADMNFFVSLWDCDPEGKEICLNRGYLKASHRELDEKQSRPWHPVYTHTNPQPLVPGQIYRFSIDMLTVANLFRAGHRMVLKISGADDVPENLSEVKMDHLCSQTPNTITIYHDSQHPSHLLVPVTKGNIIGTYVSGGDISLKNKEFMKLK
jgi:uncharacterized protein